MTRLKENQALAHSLAQKCSKCNLCFEDSQTFASVRSTGAVVSGGILTTPLANCSCIDCPVTYERHQAREQEIEALAICDALDLEVQRK